MKHETPTPLYTPSPTQQGRKRLSPIQVANRIIWVRSLLSGNYEQGREQLRTTDDKWCCLGVAGHCLDSTAPFVAADSEATLLPQRWAREKLGLSGEINEADDQQVATRWNDIREYSFAEIADLIALATVKAQHFDLLPRYPAELEGLEYGEYARRWLDRAEQDSMEHGAAT